MPSCGYLQTRQLKKLTQMNLQYKIVLPGEIPYSEICPEALLPSRGSPTSQEDTDQAEVPSTKSEGKQRFLLILLCYGFPFMMFKSFLFSKFDCHS